MDGITRSRWVDHAVISVAALGESACGVDTQLLRVRAVTGILTAAASARTGQPQRSQDSAVDKTRGGSFACQTF